MRADRLVSLMLMLHKQGSMTARNLADALEVSIRTIYRDIQALSVAGVPIYARSGTNGGVYLDEHYRVSLTGFSREEVQSLFIASDTGPLKDLGLEKAVEGTLLKLFASLPSVHRDEVERFRKRFYIDPANWFQFHEVSPFWEILQQAVSEDRKVEAVYQPVEGHSEPRVIEAYGLVAKATVWYLVGREPQKEMRNYRVSRFEQVVLLNQHFERDRDFDLAAYWLESCRRFVTKMQEDFPPYTAILRVHPKAMWYFPSYMNNKYEQVGEADEDGWVVLKVIFESMGDAATRILGFGADVEVVAPEELRERVIDTAASVVQFYGEKI